MSILRLKKTRRNKRVKKRDWGPIARVGERLAAGPRAIKGCVDKLRRRGKPPAAEPAPPSDGSRGVDLWLLAATFTLLGLGLVMVYSSSAVTAESRYSDALFFFKRDLAYVGVGLVALFVGWRVDVGVYRRYAYPILGLTVVALALLMIPGVGTRVDGAVRWFRVAGVSFQPSEPAKLALIIFLAATLARKREVVKHLTVGYLPPLAMAGIVAGLVLLQPDLGTAAVLGSATLVMLFVAGTRVSYLLLTALICAPVAYHQIVGTPWRLRRVLAFLDPIGHRHDAGYQIYESFLSLGSGGLMGQGLGAGKQKLLYLPAAHTDFILAQVGEELGFLGLAGVVLLYFLVLMRGVRAAVGARDLFSSYLAFGITATLSLQAVLHMCVVLGMVPTKGITLPLMSYGGSALVSTCFSMGVLLNVAARKPEPPPLKLRLRRTRTANRRPQKRVTVAGTS